MRVLITGSAGLVGSALAEAYASDEVFALRHRDLDITHRGAVGRTMESVRPDVVFNCAVIGVDECDADPELAQRVNVEGPEALAAASDAIGATMVHFSSNYVFDGGRTDGLAYTIDDEARPINVYGVTKLRGERAVTAAAPGALIVRTSWVFGPGKASFLATAAARLRRGQRITAITDTFAGSTYVADLTARVVELVQRRHPGTYQVVNEGALSYETFAIEAARLVGADEALIERTNESRPAPRPRWTPMRCLLSARLGFPPLRPWQEALAAYVQSGAAGS